MVESYRQDFDDSSEGYREVKAWLLEGARPAHERCRVRPRRPSGFIPVRRPPVASIHARVGEFCPPWGLPFMDLQPASAGHRDQDHSTVPAKPQTISRRDFSGMRSGFRCAGPAGQARPRPASTPQCGQSPPDAGLDPCTGLDDAWNDSMMVALEGRVARSRNSRGSVT